MKPNLALILAITAALGALPLATEGSWAKGGGGGGGGHGVSVVKTFGTIFRRDRKEDLAHLLSDIMRPGRDGEDVDSEWSVV